MFLSMPCDKWKDRSGKYITADIFHPITSESGIELYNAVEDAYNQKIGFADDLEMPFGL